jgi:host factor-I protein
MASRFAAAPKTAMAPRKPRDIKTSTHHIMDGNLSAAPHGPTSMGSTMASEKAQNLQDTFLNHVRKSKTSVTIFLVNGVKLQGFVTWFDNFCVLLRRDGHSQLVYKHAISTIMPAAPIQMLEAVDDGEHH